MLRGDRNTVDLTPMVETFGQIYRYPVEPGERADLMAPGQPCFLFRTDTAHVVGLWAIGEVVAPVLALPVDPAHPDGPTVLHAEVEMLMLQKPIAAAKLREEATLEASELFTEPGRVNPLVLEPRAVRAIEGFEFELVAPTPEQSDRLDALLAAEDAALDS